MAFSSSLELPIGDIVNHVHQMEVILMISLMPKETDVLDSSQMISRSTLQALVVKELSNLHP